MQYSVHSAVRIQEGMQQKVVTFRLPEHEFRLLTRRAAETQRTKTDVLREFIRSLELRPAREAKAKTKSPKR